MGKFREGERGYSWGKKGAPAGFPQSTMLSHNWLRGQSFPLFYKVFFVGFASIPPPPPGPERAGGTGPGAGRAPRTGRARGTKGRHGEPKGAKTGPPDRTPRPPGPDPRTGPPGPVPHRPPPHSTNSNTGATPERTRRTGPPEPDQTAPRGPCTFFRSMAMVLWPP